MLDEKFEIKAKEICNWDKRKKCDSLYIKENNRLKKKIDKALEVIEECKDKETREKIKKILEDK